MADITTTKRSLQITATYGSTFTFQLGATETDNFKAPEPVTITVTFIN